MVLLLRNSRLRLSQGQIFWQEAGQGPTLVFLHGSWSESSQWLPVINGLSGNYHCLAPDLLGFGTSEQPNLHYSVELEVEYLAEYLGTLRLGQVYLIGHSLGGWIAASYALKYPDQVQGLILMAPEGVQLEGVTNRWFWNWWLMNLPPQLFRLLRSLYPLAKRLKLQATLDQILELHQQMLHSRTACKLLFQRRQAEIGAELLQERVQGLKIPVLILQGEHDSAIAQALNQTYARLIPEAELQVLPAESDLLHSAPEAVAQRISHFTKTRT